MQITTYKKEKVYFHRNAVFKIISAKARHPIL